LTDYDALLNTASTMGIQMLESGAEAYRVEDSLLRLCRAYGVETTEIFAIPSLLIVSMCDPDGHSHTRVRRLYRRGTNLWQVDQLNSLCRAVCQGTPPAASAIHISERVGIDYAEEAVHFPWRFYL